MGLSVKMQHLANDRRDSLDLTQDLMVPETQDAESALFQPCRSTGVSVHCCACFHHRLRSRAWPPGIQNPRHRNRTPKSTTLQLAPTQVHPKTFLGFAHRFAKLSATLFERWRNASESCRHLTRSTPILAFPLGGGRNRCMGCLIVCRSSIARSFMFLWAFPGAPSNTLIGRGNDEDRIMRAKCGHRGDPFPTSQAVASCVWPMTHSWGAAHDGKMSPNIATASRS